MQFSSVFTILSILAPLIAAAPTASPTVRVQLNGLDELALQNEIPTDNSATPFGGRVTDASISESYGNSGVTCQAYSDKAATIKVGGRFGAEDVVFNGGKEVTVAAVKCRA
jgi:hypothetical protein